jgi:hypothetical protein
MLHFTNIGPGDLYWHPAGERTLSGTPVKFWRAGIELPRIRARADPQKKNGQESLFTLDHSVER